MPLLNELRRGFPLAPCLLLGALLAAGCERTSPPEPAREPARSQPPAAAEPETPSEPAGAGRPARAPDPEWVEKARAEMEGGGRELGCGDYLLFTDVDDGVLLAACDRLARELDATYLERYGLAPRGRPAEGIFLFDSIGSYRAFAAKDRRMGVGYAGFTSGVRGFTALYAGEQERGRVLSTLTHELTHLVSRRALGPGLPPWLSEGLADGVGDTATERGFRPLRGTEGVEALAGRLAAAYRGARALGLRRLAGLERGDFDRGVVSFDYEQSALLVRYLLLDPETGSRFRSYLQELAAGERYDPEALAEALGRTWPELDRAFEAWVLAIS